MGIIAPPFRPTPKNNSVVFLGDSIIANGSGNLSGTNAYRYAVGFSTWALALSKQRLYMPTGNNLGVAGESSAQIAARLSSVIALNPGYCVVLAGTNDPTPGLTPGQSIANLTTIYDTLQAAGIVVIAIPILPRASGYTTTLYGYMFQINQWIKNQRFNRGANFHVVDCGLVYADPTTGVPTTAMSSDALHPLTYGAYLIGKEVANLISSIAPDTFEPFNNILDVYNATTNPSGNLVTNGLMAGTGGTLTTATGAASTSWTLTSANSGGATVVGSKSTLADGSAAQQIDISGTVTGTNKYLELQSNNLTSNIALNDIIEAAAMIEVSAGAANIGSPQIIFSSSGTTSRFSTDMGGASTDVIGSAAYSATLRTPRVTIPVAPSFANLALRIYLKDNSSPSATVKVGRLSVRKMTSLVS